MRYPRHRVTACLTGTWISANAPRHALTIWNHQQGLIVAVHLLLKLVSVTQALRRFPASIEDSKNNLRTPFASRKGERSERGRKAKPMQYTFPLWTGHSVRCENTMFLDNAEVELLRSLAGSREINTSIVILRGKNRLASFDKRQHLFFHVIEEIILYDRKIEVIN